MNMDACSDSMHINVSVQETEGRCENMISLTAKCKMIRNKMLREKCCLLMQPHQNRTQYICAGRVPPARYLICHRAMRVHLDSSRVSVCVLGTLYPAFTYELRCNVPNMPQIHLNMSVIKVCVIVERDFRI